MQIHFAHFFFFFLPPQVIASVPTVPAQECIKRNSRLALQRPRHANSNNNNNKQSNSNNNNNCITALFEQIFMSN